MAPKLKLDHVSLLVWNLEQAIRDYQEVLSILDPEQARNIVRVYGGKEGGETMNWATFVNPNGCSIQLFEATNPDGFLQRRLRKHGEGVHHIAFTSTRIEETMAELKRRGIPLTSQELTHPEQIPWLKWGFVTPQKAHGVLIEVAQAYKVKNGEWVPDYGD